jgi:hypothetical protein
VAVAAFSINNVKNILNIQTQLQRNQLFHAVNKTQPPTLANGSEVAKRGSIICYHLDR